MQAFQLIDDLSDYPKTSALLQAVVSEWALLRGEREAVGWFLERCLCIPAAPSAKARGQWLAPLLLDEDVQIALRPDQDLLEALWVVLGRERAWRSVPLDRLHKWLRVAVRRQAWRIRRDVKMADDIWWGPKRPRGGKPLAAPRLTGYDLTEPVRVDRGAETVMREERAAKLALLQEMAAASSPQEEALLRMALAGYSAAEALATTGGTWSQWQSLQRKVRRRWDKKNFA